MDASPRVVLTDCFVVWDGVTEFVKCGTIAAIVPGSALETAYGGAGNLRPLTAQEYGHPEVSDRAWQSN